MAKTKTPKIMDGVSTTATALKLEVMELIETALKKLESGLSYLEKELHGARTNQGSNNQKTLSVKSKSTSKSKKKKTSAKKVKVLKPKTSKKTITKSAKPLKGRKKTTSPKKGTKKSKVKGKPKNKAPMAKAA